MIDISDALYFLVMGTLIIGLEVEGKSSREVEGKSNNFHDYMIIW